MSNSIVPIKSVAVLEDRVDINAEKEFAILKGGSVYTYKSWTTTSYSNSGAQFSTPAPNARILIDKKVYMKIQWLLTFTGNAGAGNVLLNYGKDAPRAFPTSQVIETLTCTINNTTLAINLRDCLPIFLYYDNGQDIKDYYTTPTMVDRYANYGDAFNSVSSPFQGYESAKVELPRGAFNYTIVQNQQMQAQVAMTIIEPILLPPWLFQKIEEENALAGVVTMDWNVTFSSGNDIGRLWSRALQGPGIAAGLDTVTSITALISAAPSMEFCYITPPLTMPIKNQYVYPYREYNRYISTSMNSLPLQGVEIPATATNNIQLKSIPKKLYVFARMTKQNLPGGVLPPWSRSDAFLPITGISIDFNNVSGILSSATQEQLFYISKKNGYTGNWMEWSGALVQQTNNFAQGPVPAVGGSLAYLGGSILCLEMGSDIGLVDDQSAGLTGNYNMYMQLRFGVSPFAVPVGVTIPYDIYVIAENEGTFSLVSGHAVTQTSVIDKKEILDAKESNVTYEQMEKAQGSSMVRSSKMGGNVMEQVKPAKSGGKMISRSDLKKKLMSD